MSIVNMVADILPAVLSTFPYQAIALHGLHAKHHVGVTGSCFQEEVWNMAGQAEGNAAEGRSNGGAEQLAPSLSEVQLVEAFFDVEQRLGKAAAAAAHPAALPQVHLHKLGNDC